MADRQQIVQTYAVTASPADALETVVATLAGVQSLFANQVIKLHGWVAITGEASATSVALKLRRDSLTGTQVGSTLTFAAADVVAAVLADFDIYFSDQRADINNATYVLTVTVAAAAGASPVSAVFLEARSD